MNVKAIGWMIVAAAVTAYRLHLVESHWIARG